MPNRKGPVNSKNVATNGKKVASKPGTTRLSTANSKDKDGKKDTKEKEKGDKDKDEKESKEEPEKKFEPSCVLEADLVDMLGKSFYIDFTYLFH